MNTLFAIVSFCDFATLCKCDNLRRRMHTAHKFKDMQEGRGHGKICAYFMDMNKQCLHIGQPLNWVTSLNLILDHQKNCMKQCFVFYS